MIASTMILTGSLIILALAGYWMRRALKAAVEIQRLRDMECRLIGRAFRAEYRLSRIIALETPSMAHVGKVAVAIARGER